MIDKYNNLAREALSTGDKILSENYFQHADHFTRILKEQESLKKLKYSENNNFNAKEIDNNTTKQDLPLKDDSSSSDKPTSDN